MIIQLDSATAENVETARRSLEALAHSWGHEMIKAPANTPEAAEAARTDDKVIDPVAVAALVVSIPSAALAVLDLADRIHKAAPSQGPDRPRPATGRLARNRVPDVP
jgi:hypothetical protein